MSETLIRYRVTSLGGRNGGKFDFFGYRRSRALRSFSEKTIITRVRFVDRSSFPMYILLQIPHTIYNQPKIFQASLSTIAPWKRTHIASKYKSPADSSAICIPMSISPPM